MALPLSSKIGYPLLSTKYPYSSIQYSTMLSLIEMSNPLSSIFYFVSLILSYLFSGINGFFLPGIPFYSFMLEERFLFKFYKSNISDSFYFLILISEKSNLFRSMLSSLIESYYSILISNVLIFSFNY